jgi:hypothetical protein
MRLNDHVCLESLYVRSVHSTLTSTRDSALANANVGKRIGKVWLRNWELLSLRHPRQYRLNLSYPLSAWRDSRNACSCGQSIKMAIRYYYLYCLCRLLGLTWLQPATCCGYDSGCSSATLCRYGSATLCLAVICDLLCLCGLLML